MTEMTYYCVVSYQYDKPHQVKRYRWPCWLRWERLARSEPATTSHFITSDNSKHVLHSPTLNRSLEKVSAVYPWLSKVYLTSITELTWLFPRLVSQLFFYRAFISCVFLKAQSTLTVGLTWLFLVLAIFLTYETIMSSMPLSVGSIYSTRYSAHVIISSFRPSSALQVWDEHIKCRKHTWYTYEANVIISSSYISTSQRHRTHVLIYDWP